MLQIWYLPELLSGKQNKNGGHWRIEILESRTFLCNSEAPWRCCRYFFQIIVSVHQKLQEKAKLLSIVVAEVQFFWQGSPEGPRDYSTVFGTQGMSLVILLKILIQLIRTCGPIFTLELDFLGVALIYFVFHSLCYIELLSCWYHFPTPLLLGTFFFTDRFRVVACK